jgi:hypothetical protein
MKRSYYYCDICGSEMGDTNSDEGYRAKRLMAKVGVRSTEIEVAVIIKGWSSKMDICEKCAKEAFTQTKRKLAFSIVGED